MDHVATNVMFFVCCKVRRLGLFVWFCFISHFLFGCLRANKQKSIWKMKEKCKQQHATVICTRIPLGSVYRYTLSRTHFTARAIQLSKLTCMVFRWDCFGCANVALYLMHPWRRKRPTRVPNQSNCDHCHDDGPNVQVHCQCWSMASTNNNHEIEPCVKLMSNCGWWNLWQ